MEEEVDGDQQSWNPVRIVDHLVDWGLFLVSNSVHKNEKAIATYHCIIDVACREGPAPSCHVHPKYFANPVGGVDKDFVVNHIDLMGVVSREAEKVYQKGFAQIDSGMC